ncbi:tetratricopeptide repeat protein [Vulcanococcus sp.]|uniref:tetratricopeptide repeat protein n=1 Tax=Vulcanococcus sp. TaxID=2856995 RepID=UPI0037DA5F18
MNSIDFVATTPPALAVNSSVSYETHAPDALLAELCQSRLAPDQAILQAKANREQDGNPHWQLPVGMAHYIDKRYSEALASLREVEAAGRANCNWLVLAGMCARQIPGLESDACDYYRQALLLDPSRADCYYNLGNLLKDEDPVEAELLYRSSLRLDSSSATVWHNFGISLNNQNRHAEALAPLRISLLLDPLVADVWCNLGLAYYGSDLFDQAERCFRFTIALDKNHAPSHLNLGNALMRSLRAEDAISFLERGVELDQSSTDSLFNLALANLLLGRYSPGWEYYEARFRAKDFNARQIPTSGPQIRRLEDCPGPGDPPLVVWSEQGMGDSIQFCRYLALLDSANVPFVFLTHPCLLNLQRGWTGLGERVQCLGSTDPASDHRPHVALMSLPLLFRTELQTVPAPVPYLSTTESVPASLRLPPPPGGLSIGFVWASNPDNKAMYRNKSMPAHLLIPRLVQLADLDLITLHTLQFGPDSEQLAPWRGHARITEWQRIVGDYSDTAHIVSQLDLVITVDTAVAHLAGALNRPTWLLLPQNADFRWLRGRSDSPWYPSMRLFRQSSHGDWHSVVQQVFQALDVMFLLDLDSLVSNQSQNVHHG